MLKNIVIRQGGYLLKLMNCTGTKGDQQASCKWTSLRNMLFQSFTPNFMFQEFKKSPVCKLELAHDCFTLSPAH